MPDDTRASLAAGGIVCRTRPDGLEVLLVHRPRYDDWTLPKGHVDPGETPIEAAGREVLEETGYRCAPGVLAGSTTYATSEGEQKVVHYWVMTVVEGAFEPNDEVDRIEWMPPDEAVGRLTYDPDRELIRSALGAA